MREAPRVEQRRRDHRPLARRERDPREQRRQRAERVGLGALRALRRAGGPRGEDHEAARLVRRRRGRRRRVDAISSSSVGIVAGSASSRPGDEPPHVAPAVGRAARRTPRRRSARPAPSRSTTSASCGAANAVFMYRASAPSFEQRQRRLDEAAVVAAHDRDAVALAGRRRRAGRARARWSGGAAPGSVSEPASSSTAASSRVVDRRVAIPAAGEVPQRAQLAQRAGELVGAHRPDHARLGEHPDVERHVPERPERAQADSPHHGLERKLVRAIERHAACRTQSLPATPPPARPRRTRSPRRARSRPCPRWSSP